MIQTDSILLDHSQIAASEGLLCSDDLLYQKRERQREQTKPQTKNNNDRECSVV